MCSLIDYYPGMQLFILLFVTCGKNLDRCADKTVHFPEFILQVTLVRKMEQLGVVDMQNEGRRVHPHLRGVIDLQLTPGV